MIVTHNLQQANRIGDRTAFMYLGELVEYGSTDQVFEAPRAPAHARLRRGDVRMIRAHGTSSRRSPHSRRCAAASRRSMRRRSSRRRARRRSSRRGSASARSTGTSGSSAHRASRTRTARRSSSTCGTSAPAPRWARRSRSTCKDAHGHSVFATTTWARARARPPPVTRTRRDVLVDQRPGAAERNAETRRGPDRPGTDTRPCSERSVDQPVKLTNDPVSGAELSGKVQNTLSVTQTHLVIFAVAKKGRQDRRRRPRDPHQACSPGKTASFHVFFIGNPGGAQLSVVAPATVIGS